MAMFPYLFLIVTVLTTVGAAILCYTLLDDVKKMVENQSGMFTFWACVVLLAIWFTAIFCVHIMWDMAVGLLTN